MKIKTSIIINASTQQVFETLTDFKNYKKWNQFMLNVYGKALYAESIKVVAKIPHGPKLFFKAKITRFQTGMELRWRGNFIVDKLFVGEHFFILREINESQTELIHGEDFSGWLLGIFKIVLSGSEEGYHLMNKNLKDFIEQKDIF